MSVFYRILLLAMWFILPYMPGYAQKASQAPVPQTLNLSPDNLRALQNSVNLFTGQVAFPMELASLPGRGGLNMSVAIQYNSSGLDKIIDAENQYGPTGVLGLGWSLDIPRIVADNKQTGARQDDSFYFIESGVSNPLICKTYSPTFTTFDTQNFSAWKIGYYPEQERWVIVRENGFKYTYRAVQWMVKWGNWIGNSSQTQNQSRSAYVWAISEVENLWGDKLTFQYNLIEEAVGSDGLSHTKAFYLSKVIDPIGQSIELNYQPKASNEYLDPHQERAEPDAYQEKYESLYLGGLTVKTAGNSVLYSVVLQFEPLATDNKAKRYLKTIQKQFPSGESQPAIEFEYFPSGTSSGYLKKVFNAVGAHIDYYYKSVTFDSGFPLGIIAPPGYGQMKSYVAGDYCVVTWRKLKSDRTVDDKPQPVRVRALYWDGDWKLSEIGDILGVSNDDYQLAEIAVQARHFVYRLFSIENHTFHVYAAHLKAYTARGDVWEKKELSYPMEGKSLPNDIGHVFAGEDFVCFNVRWLSTIEVQTWHDEQWVSESIQINDPEFENYLTAGGNFIFLHNDNKGGQDQLHLYYLNGEKEWTESKVPAALSFTTEGPRADVSHWHACNSFVFGLPQYNPEYVFMWDENYGNFVKTDAVGQYHDASWISTFPDGMVGLSQPNHQDGVALRYDGKNWHKQTYGYLTHTETSYAPDLIVRADNFFAYDRPGCLSYAFNPNTLQWELNNYGSLEYDHLNDQYGRAIQAGIDMFMRNQWLMRRQTDGSWSYGEMIPMGASEYLIGNTAVVMAPSYVAYEYSNTPKGKAEGMYILYLKNNRIERTQKLPGFGLDASKTNAGLSTLALRHLDSSGDVTMYHMTDHHMINVPTAGVVGSTVWSDGNHVFKTQYEYANGRRNATGTPQFNAVSTVQGDQQVQQFPNGVSTFYFYNGFSVGQLQEHPPSERHLGEENLLTGLPYCIIARNSSQAEVSRITHHYSISSIPVKNSNQRVIDSSKMVRVIKTDQLADGIFTAVENTYDPATGLLKTSKQSNSGATGNTEQVTTTNTYWWEVYDPGRTRNLLSPVVQTKSVNVRTGSVGSRTYISTAATKWSHNTTLDKYFPTMSYAWQHSGSPDFVAWSNAATPSSDWLLTSKVNEFDPADGTVFETEQNDGSRSAMIFDGAHTRLLAKVSFSDFDQVAYSSFENNAPGNWSYNTTFTTGTAVFAGSKSFFASGNVDSRINSKTLQADTYEVSFWSKGLTAVAEVENGSVLQTSSEEVQNGWTLTRTLFQIASGGGRVRIKVPANSWLDEARLRPRGAEMTTYVYDDTGNILVETDTNLFQRRFEYDTQYRLSVVRDHQGRVVKTYVYHYRNQP